LTVAVVLKEHPRTETSAAFRVLALRKGAGGILNGDGKRAGPVHYRPLSEHFQACADLSEQEREEYLSGRTSRTVRSVRS
jgi:hypothetical protein